MSVVPDRHRWGFYDLTAVFREWSREWFRAFQRIVLAFPWKLGYDRQRFSMRYT